MEPTKPDHVLDFFKWQITFLSAHNILVLITRMIPFSSSGTYRRCCRNVATAFYSVVYCVWIHYWSDRHNLQGSAHHSVPGNFTELIVMVHVNRFMGSVVEVSENSNFHRVILNRNNVRIVRISFKKTMCSGNSHYSTIIVLFSNVLQERSSNDWRSFGRMNHCCRIRMQIVFRYD